MKKFLLATSLISTVAMAQIQEEFFVYHTEKDIINQLTNSPELVIDHLSSSGFELYGPKGTAQYLKSLNLNFVNVSKAMDTKSVKFLDYPSFEMNTRTLQNIVKKYPDLVTMTSIGKSTQGRELWMLKISDNVKTDELEPEFKYISSMHGDEITGRELTIKLIQDLLESYVAGDNEIVELINNTELFIMPSMNPDGSELRQRANARGKDLNRNFPDITNGEANSFNNREIETQLIMKYQPTRNFALSANFHGGAVVVNYPWDSKYERHPLDSMIQEISLKYADLNPEMRSSREFSRGIVNGADWYVVRGGMQDWSYVFHNDLQLTIELSDDKWPNYSEIPAFYNKNKDSMIELIKVIHQGAGFAFTNKTLNAKGTVKIMTNDGVSIGSFGFSNGEFYKVLTPGKYIFEIKSDSAPTLIKKEIEVVASEVTVPNYLTL
jgi:hypothetical protein